ncbi:MAG: hypothetical protein QG628_1032 [Patescibacteria group bacterium]|nr:hypothetical protein [Patescibacteria group bacterium]
MPYMSTPPTPLKPLPGIEAWQLSAPALPEIPTPPQHEAEALIASQEVPRFLRIRQFLAERALEKVETKYLDETRHDTVIKAAAMSAQMQHGFYKGLPSETVTQEPDHIVPITFTEKATSTIRQRQDKKRRSTAHAGHNAVSLYEKSPSYKDFLPDNFDSMTVDQQNWATMQAKLKVVGAPKTSTLHNTLESIEGTKDEFGRVLTPPVEMPNSVKKLHRGNDSLHTRKHYESNYYQDSMDRGANGDTLPGRRRSNKIAKTERKMIKIQRKVDNYDRLAYIKARDAERSRQEPNEGKLDDLQFEFGRKWAADIHRNLVRSSHGRALIKDKGRRVQDGHRA